MKNRITLYLTISAIGLVVLILAFAYVQRSIERLDSTSLTTQNMRSPTAEPTDRIYRVPVSTAEVVRATANAAINMAISREYPNRYGTPIPSQ